MSEADRTAATRALPRVTDRLPLGSAGLTVSPICIGLAGDSNIVAAAYEAGINFFFVSADMHWPLYEETRRGIRDLLASKPAARDEIVVGVVAYVTQPEFCWYPYQEALDEVGNLGRIDLTIAGGSYGHEIDRRLEVYEKHRAVKHLGARAIGVSFHDRKSAADVIGRGTIDIGYVRYNPKHPGARTDVFPHLTTRDAGRKTLLFNFKSTDGFLEEAEYAKHGIADDFWRPHQTDYYRFVLTTPVVDGILCALPHVAAVGELVDALAKGPLDEDDHQYLLDLGELARGEARVA